jgi:hypothetical protein
MTRRNDPSAPHPSIGASEPENHVVYRRLLFRGYVLYARVTALQMLLATVSPFAPPRIIRAIHRWFANVAMDVNALNSAAHALRLRIAAQRNARPALAERTMPVEVQNPWL